MTLAGSRCTMRLVGMRLPSKWSSTSLRGGGRLALHWAVRYRPLPIARLLAEGWEKALLEGDGNGLVPLHHAARFKAVPVAVVQYLVDRCPQALQRKDWEGRVPLHWSVCANTAEVVQVLADAYPEALMERANDGLLPLHVAAKNRPLEFVRSLFEMCPRAVQETSSDGFLPLDIAAKSYAPLDVIYFLARSWPRAISCDREKVDPPAPINLAAAPSDWCFGCTVQRTTKALRGN
jgi:Ankyrin repeats (3 copies)